MEEHIAREHDALVGHVNDDIALGMRGTDINDIDRHAIEVVASIRVEHRRRRREDDIAEVEGRELVHEIA